jgi:hypothetical protein
MVEAREVKILKRNARVGKAGERKTITRKTRERKILEGST